MAATDAMFRSSLSRALWPLVETPADGAVVSLPLTVQWEGPAELYLTLTGVDIREDLGLRQNPTEIGAEHFPRPGRYQIEVRSPIFGRWSVTRRRFVVSAASPSPIEAARGNTVDQSGQIEDLTSAMDRETRQHEITKAENAALHEENAGLREENNGLATSLEDLRHLQTQTAARLEALEAQQGELEHQYHQAVEENQRLRARIASIPECTNWGYVSYQRGVRFVMVSDARGEIFHDQILCEATRRNDPTAASACFCAGSPWQR
jgi:hypothetical protein